jgi:hypothetical protein
MTFRISLLFEKSFCRPRPSDTSGRPKAQNEFARLGDSQDILFPEFKIVSFICSKEPEKYFAGSEVHPTHCFPDLA